MGQMSEDTFLITGAAGYLGRRVVLEASGRGTVVAASHRPSHFGDHVRATVLDVTDRDAVLRLFDRFAPKYVVHTAAVNPGQGDDATMHRVNVDGSAYVAQGAEAVGARLVAISTDVVHDGRRGPYSDSAPASPLNHYGRTKAAGEEATLAADPTAAVVRTSLMYGLDEMDRGTAGFAESLSAGGEQVLFSDVLRTPILVDTLARAIVCLSENEYSGYLNVAGRQALSREAYGRSMLEYWGVPSTDRLRSGLAADVSDSIPLDLRLDVSKAELLLGFPLPGLDEVLKKASIDGSLSAMDNPPIS